MANGNALKQTLVGLLGETAGTKLFQLLNACCDVLEIGTLTVTGNATVDGDVSVGGALTVDTINEATANAGVTVEGVKLENGGISNPGETAFAAFYFNAAQDDIAAGTGGAISVANYLTTINTDAGGDAFTLANGTQIGQMKKIELVVDGGGDGVVTPATAFAGGGATATFGDAGDFIILIRNGTAWRVLENSGVVVA